VAQLGQDPDFPLTSAQLAVTLNNCRFGHAPAECRQAARGANPAGPEADGNE